MSADKLASFRVDSQLWEHFQGYAKNNNVTATALLISYIKSVVSGNNVNTSTVDNVNTNTEKKPSLSIQNINTLSLQDIDNRIKLSIQDGDIAGAIATSYADMMGQFNLLVDQVHELKSQLSAIKSQESGVSSQESGELPTIDPVSSQESAPISNYQLPNNSFDRTIFIGILGIDHIIYMNQTYDKNSLVPVMEKMAKHKDRLQSELNIKLRLDHPKYIVREFNKILAALGYQWDNKQIKGVETYWIKH